MMQYKLEALHGFKTKFDFTQDAPGGSDEYCASPSPLQISDTDLCGDIECNQTINTIILQKGSLIEVYIHNEHFIIRINSIMQSVHFLNNQ